MVRRETKREASAERRFDGPLSEKAGPPNAVAIAADNARPWFNSILKAGVFVQYDFRKNRRSAAWDDISR